MGECCFAQNGPRELAFRDARIVDSVSAEGLFFRAGAWEKYQERKDNDIDHHINDRKSKIVEYFHIVHNCPNFGVSKFLGGDGTMIDFVVKIECLDGMYTAEISHIDVVLNPSLGVLYGEGGALYENLYNRKQLKMGKKIVEFLSGYAESMFEEIYGFMSGQ